MNTRKITNRTYIVTIAYGMKGRGFECAVVHGFVLELQYPSLAVCLPHIITVSDTSPDWPESAWPLKMLPEATEWVGRVKH